METLPNETVSLSQVWSGEEETKLIDLFNSEKYSIPAGASFKGVGVVSSDIPTYLGASLNADALTNAAMYTDLIISIGC